VCASTGVSLENSLSVRQVGNLSYIFVLDGVRQHRRLLEKICKYQNILFSERTAN